jgi:hypothetical protein
MPSITINKNTGTFVVGRRSPRLAANATVRFEPRRIVFPEEEAAAATAKTHRTSPRLAGYYAEREAKEAQRKAIFKLIDETLAFSAAHKKAIEAPAPAEKVVFQVTYDPRTKKHVTFLWGL